VGRHRRPAHHRPRQHRAAAPARLGQPAQTPADNLRQAIHDGRNGLAWQVDIKAGHSYGIAQGHTPQRASTNPSPATSPNPDTCRNGSPARSPASPAHNRQKPAPVTPTQTRAPDCRSTMLLVLKVPTRGVMDTMGWSQASMTSRYQHVPPEVLASIANQVRGLLWNSDEDA
jgi:hypothetical protein